jgi:hypothetical protein
MGQRKQVKRQVDLDESQNSAQSETSCAFEDAQGMFDTMIEHSEELFNADVQEFILEREHLINYSNQVAFGVEPN